MPALWLGIRGVSPANGMQKICEPLVSVNGNAADVSEVCDRVAGVLTGLCHAFARLSEGPAAEKRFVECLLHAGSLADTGRVRCRADRLRPLVDVSVPLVVLRGVILGLLEWKPNTGLKPRDIITLIIKHQPGFDAGLALLAEDYLASGDLEQAAMAARKLLARSCFSTAAEHVLRQVQMLSRPACVQSEAALVDRFCPAPFASLYTSYQGACFGCVPIWLPFPIGQLSDCTSLDEVWNSAAAREIRRSVLDGDFSYCSREFCTYLRCGSLPTKAEITNPLMRHYIDEHQTKVDQAPRLINLSHDGACNLACPSCRTHATGNDPQTAPLLADWKDRLILPYLRKAQSVCMLSCNGDPLASRHYSGILAALNQTDYPGVTVALVTNGQLLTPAYWDGSAGQGGSIRYAMVSVDAATASTYEQLRPPGRWQRLMENLAHLSMLRQSGRLQGIGMFFVVQASNFREMPDFVRLGKSLHMDYIVFQRYLNFGTDDGESVAQNDVASAAHPSHGELLRIVADPVFNYPAVGLMVRDGSIETPGMEMFNRLLMGLSADQEKQQSAGGAP